MTPQTGNVGSQVTLSINYDSPQSPGNYKILWSKTQIFAAEETQVIKNGVISNGATSTVVQIIVPESTYGNHFIRFIPDNGADFINFQFGVLPGLKVKPSSVLSGTVVSVYGNGFPANDIIIFKMDSQFMGTHVSTNKSGSFAGQLTLPNLSAGEHKLTAMTQLAGLSSSTLLEILPVVNKSDDTAKVDQDTTTTVPADSANSKNTVNEPELDDIAPPMPTPISPVGNRIGLIGSQPVTIQWAKVSDESGVTYVIEISENHAFSSGRLIRESGLNSNHYTTMLQPGTYYWRVKAIDSAGNESHWSYAPYPFKVGELSIIMEEFGRVLNNNGEIVMIVISSLVALIIIIAIISSIRSLTKPGGK